MVWTNLKAFADDKLNVAKMISAYGRTESIVGKGKGENSNMVTESQIFAVKG